MKKIKVTSIEVDGVTISLEDAFTSGAHTFIIRGFKGRMVEFMTYVNIKYGVYEMNMPTSYCYIEELIKYPSITHEELLEKYC